MAKRVLHVVTNVSHYEDSQHRTGLWLTELTHAWEIFEHHGLEQVIMSPLGGETPLEPRSLKVPNIDEDAKKWLNDPAKRNLLENTKKPSEIDVAEIDAIYFTGGHATMYDFFDNAELQQITREMFEADKIVASVCHGFCALLNVELSSGDYLIKGKKMTGFSWNEERLAGVSKLVPYNGEEIARARGAKYQKGILPFTANVVVDRNLVTGQNPGSALATAKKIVSLLK